MKDMMTPNLISHLMALPIISLLLFLVEPRISLKRQLPKTMVMNLENKLVCSMH